MDRTTFFKRLSINSVALVATLGLLPSTQAWLLKDFSGMAYALATTGVFLYLFVLSAIVASLILSPLFRFRHNSQKEKRFREYLLKKYAHD